ncbi:MAG: sulfur carrier protein ThiS [Actinomycetota bacterium]
MQVVVNGTGFDLSEETTVSELLRMRGLDPRYVVVERNGEPLSRDRYGAVLLEDGDRLELVRAVAGG